ncbi:recombination-associated protein RdgC [Teredinibacter sp. KSP-S5-2]|uniref:recombination-associated protein RdgC n=1 Tax=Teredinibacter sp. KSP-S5-2 TaxID=3034506 RepID=UPI002934FFD0|nr:recombination-associated protein RdgC [Teredinibacter sp. KSP-S5-2]WNO07729.1 recombination-associated protein RdgC [Teredinibacter sp. KSP-S5-2]
MWFKNLQVFRFTQPFKYSPEELQELLEKKPFSPCFGQELFSYGWVSPLGRNGNLLVHVCNGYIMVCAKRQERVLPSAVVKEYVEEQVEQIERDEGRKVGGKEKRDMRDEATFTLLPKAFTRSSLQFAYIAPKEGLLVIDAASAKRSEELMSCLRECLGRLSVLPLASKNLPRQVMTEWLTQSHEPEHFEFGMECELRGLGEDSGIIRCKNQDLVAEEIVSHLKTGMQVSKLALAWEGGIECVVDEQLAIKRLKFTDIIQDKADDVTVDSAADQFDLDFSIMAPEVSGLLRDLVAALGGESDIDTDDEE